MGPTAPKPISFIQNTAIPSFSKLKGDDSNESKYERLNSLADDRTKVENLGQYLEGAAADWLSVLRNEKLESYTLDEDGVQTTEWHELSWEELKRMFEKEFGEVGLRSSRAEPIFTQALVRRSRARLELFEQSQRSGSGSARLET